MYSVDVYLRVRRAVMVEGMSIREATRTFDLHRDTVRKMLAYSVPPGYQRQTPPRRPKLEPPFSRGQALPGYSPDFNADEAIWGWAREEATGNLCLGSKVKVQERVGNFLAGLSSRKDEVRRRCRTVLQSRAEALLPNSQPDSPPQANAHPTLALV